MKTIKVRVGWTKRMVTYIDFEVDEEIFNGTLTQQQREDVIEMKDYQAEEWIDEESYDFTAEVVEE